MSATPWASETAGPSRTSGKEANHEHRPFVGNLSFETNELGLRDLFGQLGQILEVKVVTDRETGCSRGFAFMEMTSADDADKAIFELNGRELGGRSLKAIRAQSRPYFDDQTSTRAART